MAFSGNSDACSIGVIKQEMSIKVLS